MFDIGFSELLLVLVIGLIVLGPERLPVAVKTIAGWVRVLRSLAANVQNELAKELKLQELQDSLKKMEEKADLQSLSPELKASMDELRETAESLKKSYQLSLEEAKELEEDETHFHPLESDPVPGQKLTQDREQVTEKKPEEISTESTKQNTKQSPEKSNSEH
ncbi:Sec-independent protein translocase protein TatB [Xenorhabdus siamensis]|uniref:Sec-independent protein translocase protein TatB n=1 Tax=Xenorhabdus siamensis TaxID=3136254 RepID=UPI0030F429EB